MRPHVRRRYPPQGAEAGQPPVCAGQASGGSGGPRQGHGAHRASAVPGGAARWGGSGERAQDGPHDRALREHAPCTPQRGDHRGCERRVGRATTGATRHAPPPLQRDGCRASCLRRACVVPPTWVQRRDDDKASPHTHTPPPPPGLGIKVGRGGLRPPPPPPRGQSGKVGRQRREGAGRTTGPCL